MVNFPIKLNYNRVWRTYQGGDILNELQGQNKINEPEEWIASMVVARNIGREHIPNEGASVLSQNPKQTLKQFIEQNPIECLGENHINQCGINTGVLVKLIDSNERLTIQVHPDRQKAMELFGSHYGKTESWYILNNDNEVEKPYIYLGFKEGITREYWKELFEKQDIKQMLNCLHKFEVKQQDAVLICGGVPHAIGKGCFLLETQEPTDYTIRVERTTPSGLEVNDFLCHQGLGFDKMFDCFNYEGKTREETYETWFIKPVETTDKAQNKIRQVIKYKDTPFFSANAIDVKTELTLDLSDQFSVLYILEGHGQLKVGSKKELLNAGDQFFIPATINELHITNTTNAPLRMMQCFGPQIEGVIE
ncbi:MAG: hypothetical protein BEN18_07330 [Epulopiscium sp. Nuni2H_MBin001]|nr:MAG: hypothetical protein BEN18_07330 [Epulopiscium sp. Nuni2H_MBin001]